MLLLFIICLVCSKALIWCEISNLNFESGNFLDSLPFPLLYAEQLSILTASPTIVCLQLPGLALQIGHFSVMTSRLSGGAKKSVEPFTCKLWKQNCLYEMKRWNEHSGVEACLTQHTVFSFSHLSLWVPSRSSVCYFCLFFFFKVLIKEN